MAGSQRRSGERGQGVATRPATEADADEPKKESPADGLPANAESEVARRIPVKTSARTNKKLRLRLEGRGNEVRMRVAQVCGMGVTVRGLRRNLEVRI